MFIIENPASEYEMFAYYLWTWTW